MKSLSKAVTVSLLAALVTAVIASPALAADVAPKTSLVSLADEGRAWLTAATAGPTVASDPTARSTADAPTGERAIGAEQAPLAEQAPFIDFLPNASLIARDWRGSIKIAGDHTMLVDDLRPSASNRMLIGRIATNEARISLFAQIGVGEWRIDTVMFPNAVSYSEVAGQVGGGFQLRISPRLHIASELQYTMLYRDLHYAEGEVAPRMTSFVIAAAGRF
jgi:hypothetical protein